MTDAINPLSRPAPSDILARKALDKLAQSATAAPTAGAPVLPEMEVVASKAAAAAKGADVAGFNEIKARLKQAPDFDRSKVDAIKQAIANGQYPLNPRRIAESFVGLEQMIGH
jgi:negative regulator of flagellin synthesis FlgM